MVDLLLWKRLYPNDFNAINGLAAPSGTGGGAMHISLGKHRPGNTIRTFLGVATDKDTTIKTEAWLGHHGAATLTFGINPARKNEWRLADQFHHRHPAWAPSAGFPTAYNPADRPVVFVAKINGLYHARFATQSQFIAAEPTLGARDRGVAALTPALQTLIGTPIKSILEEYQDEENTTGGAPEFDPKSVKDGRKKVFAEIMRRRGQQKFRAEILKAYGGTCAITDCSDEEVLEAAHISPYRGPETNKADNGLLLRADIHTLFDLGLISVDPTTMKIRVSSLLKDPTYSALDGKPLNTGHPAVSSLVLQEHYERFKP